MNPISQLFYQLLFSNWLGSNLLLSLLLYFNIMGKRQIKKTVIKYDEKVVTDGQDGLREQRQRSRQKQSSKANQREETVKIQEVNVNSRRARLQAMRRAKQQEEVQQEMKAPAQIQVKIQELIVQNVFITEKVTQQKLKQAKKEVMVAKRQEPAQEQNQSQQEEQQRTGVIKKPVFIAKEYREDKLDEEEEELKQEQRRKKNVKYTTKMLLQQQKYEDSQEQNQNSDSQNDVKANAINDDDTVDEQLQFQFWKIRELNRIRRDREERRKHQMEKAEINRRRQMTNQAVLLQNRQLGSDATDNNTETKYVFMQKYYHRGAFYQDSEDEVFKRDYNLPTPMQMQDKSLLPQILQKRVGNFGKKGQSKYTHLTAQDTSDLNPLTRPDESILQSWKRKTAGYKGSYSKNV